MDLATLGLAVDSRPVADASKELDRITAAAKRAEDAATGFGKRTEDAGRRAAAANDNVARSADKVTAAYDKWHTAARRVATAVGAIAGALAVRSLTSYADAWSDMQSRVGAAIRDMEAAPALMKRIVDIANASYSPLDQTVEIYARNVAVLRDLGRGATEAADFTEALNHALVLTATRGERAASVQNALSKAMAVGKMQAQELETILAHGGEVAQVLADELGTTVNGLRAMASAGNITGNVIANALIKRLEDLRERAGKMPATIGDAFVRIQTNLTAFIGQMDQATGASQRVSEAIMLVADNIDVIARVAAVAGVALLTAFAPAILSAMASGLVAIGTAGVAAMRALTIAVAANPIGALVVAITTAVTAAYLFRDEIKQAIGIDFVAIIEGAINTVVGVFVGGFNAIKATWSDLPAAMGDLSARAGQMIVNGTVAAINLAIDKIKEFYVWINPFAAAAKIAGFDVTDKLPGGNIAAPEVPNPFKGAAESVGQRWQDEFADAMSRDYVGELKEIVFGTKSATEATDAMTSAIKAANDNLSQTEGAAGKAAKGIKDVKQEADKAAESARKFGADLVKGFVSDLRSGLEQGKSFWESFANAATRALDRIVDKLLNDLIDAIFQVNSAGGGGGGLLGMLGGMFGMQMFPGGMGFATPGYTPWAKGGAFYHGNVIPFAKGGIVHGPTVFPFAKGIGLMGEAGPEAIMPLHRGPDGSLGVKAANQNNANQNVRVEVEVFVNDDGKLGAIARQAGGEAAQVTVKQGLAAYDKGRQKRYQAGGQFG